MPRHLKDLLELHAFCREALERQALMPAEATEKAMGQITGPIIAAGNSVPAIGTPETRLFLEPQNRITISSSREKPRRSISRSGSTSRWIRRTSRKC